MEGVSTDYFGDREWRKATAAKAIKSVNEAPADRDTLLLWLQERNLPKPLRWLVRHRWLLALALRLRPSWMVEVSVGVDYAGETDTTVELAHLRDGRSFVIRAETVTA